jgi:hypothetical protein
MRLLLVGHALKVSGMGDGERTIRSQAVGQQYLVVGFDGELKKVLLLLQLPLIPTESEVACRMLWGKEK